MNNKTVLGIIIGLLALMGVIVFATSQPNDDIELPTPEEVTNERVRSPEEVTLSVGESVDAAGLELKLNEFVQDNRCSIDEDCMEAGGVVVNVTMKSAGSQETRNLASDEVAYEFEGYAIAITRISPPRTLNEEINENEYEITFFVKPIILDGDIPANI